MFMLKIFSEKLSADNVSVIESIKGTFGTLTKTFFISNVEVY